MPSKRKKNHPPPRKHDRIIHYLYKGIPCHRRLPELVRQTAATRFGAVSRTGRIIRHAFAPWLHDNRHDGEWVYRLNARLLAAGAAGLKGYRFIDKKHITHFLQFAISQQRTISANKSNRLIATLP